MQLLLFLNSVDSVSLPVNSMQLINFDHDANQVYFMPDSLNRETIARYDQQIVCLSMVRATTGPTG